MEFVTQFWGAEEGAQEPILSIILMQVICRTNFENPVMGNTWVSKSLQDQKRRIKYVGLMLDNFGVSGT